MSSSQEDRGMYDILHKQSYARKSPLRGDAILTVPYLHSRLRFPILIFKCNNLQIYTLLPTITLLCFANNTGAWAK
jgi:hypothetical protein